MAIKLSGTISNGIDRRYYLIDVQVAGRRIRLSTGTRNKDLALSREQKVLDAIRADFLVTLDELREVAMGSARAERFGFSSGQLGFGDACDQMLSCPDTTMKLELQTIQFYKKNCRELVAVIGAKTPVNEIKKTAIDTAIKAFLAKGNSLSTINRKLITLQKVLKYAVSRGALKSLPVIPKYAEAGPRKFYFDHETEDRLLDALLTLDTKLVTEVGGHPRKTDAHRYRELFIILLDTGVRVSKGIRIEWSDISLIANEIRVWDDVKKGKARTLPMTDRVVEILTKIREGEHHPVGPFHDLNVGRAQKLLTQAKKEIGLTHPQAVLHAMRHTTATRLLEGTGDIKLVQEWLGHSSIQTTANTYAHVTASKFRQGASVLSQGRKQ